VCEYSRAIIYVKGNEETKKQKRIVSRSPSRSSFCVSFLFLSYQDFTHTFQKMNSTSSSTRKSKQSEVHPLLRYDPDILDGGIQLLKLEYFEAETTRAPVPRNQKVPKEAFGRLTGRSILVATSHAWFYQYHPDPHGVKLATLRKEFFPRLRKRFPRTQILIFDDWHSCPQWPRTTQEENDRFKKCMDHMNSVYCYCDVVLFVEAPLPDLDNTVFFCDLVPSEHKWLHFIDTIQYLGGNDKKISIRKNDIVIKMRNVKKILTINVLKERKEKTTISFLRRPYGRPNRRLADERGWLYAERITLAIRMAAARPEMFDDVVISNDSDLVRQILLWTEELRTSAKKEKKHPGSISKQLNRFRDVLATKKFTFLDSNKLVDEIMTDLVKQFEENWKEETKRQSDMATRTRELLLRWGSFSESYVERAELLCDSDDVKDRRSWIFLSLIVGVIIPATSVMPFVFSLEEDGEDPSRDGLVVSSVWLGICVSIVGAATIHGCVHAFVNIPLGLHTVLDCFARSSICVFISIVFRNMISSTVIPLEMLIVSFLGVLLFTIFFKVTNCIPIRDTRTKQTKMWQIGQYFLPASHRFDPKVTADVMRVDKTCDFGFTFACAYPLLGGIFFQSGIFIQALLIPVFFFIRGGYEYGVDAITAHTFGSDGMPAINFGGVLMHEICLSVMITSIKHPLVFVSLVLSDVLENSFCLWSLARNAKRSLKRVSPADDEEESVHRRKSLTRRSSNVISLVMNKDDVSDKGTALFIAATLLQREAVETLVPIQAAAVLSILYKVDVKSNSIVSDWGDEDWTQCLMYIVSLSVWMGNLLFQSTYTGIDLTMKFDWLGCRDKANSTWLGGFVWEC